VLLLPHENDMGNQHIFIQLHPIFWDTWG